MFHFSGLSYEWESGVKALAAGAALGFLFRQLWEDSSWWEQLLRPLGSHPFPASPDWLDASN